MKDYKNGSFLYKIKGFWQVVACSEPGGGLDFDRDFVNYSY